MLDEDLSSALAALRDRAGPELPEAGLARKAVLEGVALDAILRTASAHAQSDDEARLLLRSLRMWLSRSAMPPPAMAALLGELDRADQHADLQERRRRQRALLRSPDPHGPAALAIAESFDAFDELLS